MEEWKEIEVEGYSISSYGRFRNDRSGRILGQSQNRIGVMFVSPRMGYSQRSLSTALLVAKAFLEKPIFVSFDTPIHLDGDKSNNRVDNLMWRPRWFAMKYAKQFNAGSVGGTSLVEDLETGERLTSWEMATKYGLLQREVILSALSENDEKVWPTLQRFVIVPK